MHLSSSVVCGIPVPEAWPRAPPCLLWAEPASSWLPKCPCGSGFSRGPARGRFSLCLLGLEDSEYACWGQARLRLCLTALVQVTVGPVWGLRHLGSEQHPFVWQEEVDLITRAPHFLPMTLSGSLPWGHIQCKGLRDRCSNHGRASCWKAALATGCWLGGTEVSLSRSPP